MREGRNIKEIVRSKEVKGREREREGFLILSLFVSDILNCLSQLKGGGVMLFFDKETHTQKGQKLDNHFQREK